MEAFEQFVAVALEAEGLVVSAAVKFPVRRQVRKKARIEYQEHGYEVDLVGARSDRLVLASVKSFFGSGGAKACEVTGRSGDVGLYRLLNDPELREAVVAKAAERYGYQKEQVYLRLYVGKFAGKKGSDEALVRAWCETQRVGAGPIVVVELRRLVEQVRITAARRTYINNPVLVSMKVLAAVGLLEMKRPVTLPDPAMLDEGASLEDEGKS